MKAFAMLGLDKIGFIEKERPVCGPYDAICRPLAISPCTSDVHTVWEHALGDRHNLILGHEASAEVVEVGSLVKDFKPGDKVIVPAITPDWQAVESQSGYSMHSHGMLNGWKFSNVKDGVFAEYFHVNEADGNLAHLPKEISIENAVMLSDMVPTGFHGANLAEVEHGDIVVVIGIGPVGLMAVAGAVLRGASRVFAVGSRQICREVAKFYGATDLINYRNGDIVAQVKEAMGGKPVDKVIIAGGNNDTFGWGRGMGHIRIVGGLMPGGRKNMEFLARLMTYGRLDVSPMLTHKFDKFEDMETAILLMKDKPKDLIKPVIRLA